MTLDQTIPTRKFAPRPRSPVGSTANVEKLNNLPGNSDLSIQQPGAAPSHLFTRIDDSGNRHNDIVDRDRIT